MSYHNYRERKKEKLVKLNKRIIINKVVSEGKVKEEEQVFFDLESKRFSEKDGTLYPQPEREELNIEALGKEKVLLQGFIVDIEALLDDIEELKKEGE